MEEVTIIKYKVGGYWFDNKSLAEELDKKLKDNVNKIICTTCCGTRKVQKVVHVYDLDVDKIIPKISEQKCDKCKDGTLTKIVKTEYVT